MRQATAEAEESLTGEDTVNVNETGADAVNETEEEKNEEAVNVCLFSYPKPLRRYHRQPGGVEPEKK